MKNVYRAIRNRSGSYKRPKWMEHSTFGMWIRSNRHGWWFTIRWPSQNCSNTVEHWCCHCTALTKIEHSTMIDASNHIKWYESIHAVATTNMKEIEEKWKDHDDLKITAKTKVWSLIELNLFEMRKWKGKNTQMDQLLHHPLFDEPLYLLFSKNLRMWYIHTCIDHFKHHFVRSISLLLPPLPPMDTDDTIVRDIWRVIC